jgi:hypothetical protein
MIILRLAKWNDHKGDLKTAITMEKAKEILPRKKIIEHLKYGLILICDLYHWHRIQESYDSYLKTLAIDPYSYAKRNCLIVFSQERKEAKKEL